MIDEVQAEGQKSVLSRVLCIKAVIMLRLLAQLRHRQLLIVKNIKSLQVCGNVQVDLMM